MMLQRLEVAALFLIFLATAIVVEKTKIETLDTDPHWGGVNNRSTRTIEPATIRQDFGYHPTQKSGGAKGGQIRGFIMPADEGAISNPVRPCSTISSGPPQRVAILIAVL